MLESSEQRIEKKKKQNSNRIYSTPKAFGIQIYIWCKSNEKENAEIANSSEEKSTTKTTAQQN